jgi:dolichol-phosphate mannosyltransferase
MTVNIIVSVYNESENLPLLAESLKKELKNINHTLTFVNDCSSDNSLQVLKEIKSNTSNVSIINFSRNFGHEAAMIAGIDNSKSDINICMDADMQHPPQIIPEIIEKAKQGYNIITLKRVTRQDHSKFKQLLSKLFYLLLNKLSPLKFEPNASDFFMVDKKVAAVLKKDYRERNRFLRGFVQSVGFNKTSLLYDAPDRANGESNYGFIKLFKLSINAIVAFSEKPLHLGLYLGVIFSILSIAVGLYSVIMKFTGVTPPGYTTLVVIMSAFFAVQFFLIGIIGLYIGFVFNEQKRRPIYIIEDIE